MVSFQAIQRSATFLSPEGAEYDSPGQRPGERVWSPEGAKSAS